MTTSLRFPQLWDGCIYAMCPSRDRSRSNIVTDFSGGNAVSSLVNMDPATDWVARAGGVALDLDATNDHVQLPTAKYLMVTGRPFAVTWWENLTSSGVTYMSRFQLPTEGQATSWICFSSTAAGYTPICWSYTNGTNGTGFRPLSAPTIASSVGLWRHYCITGINATSAVAADHSIYIDGIDYTLGSVSAINAKSTARIGWDGAISGANTLIDDVRIYSRRLMQAEAQLLARRRGIAYEVKRSRIRQTAAAGSPANSGNLLLLGVG